MLIKGNGKRRVSRTRRNNNLANAVSQKLIDNQSALITAVLGRPRSASARSASAESRGYGRESSAGSRHGHGRHRGHSRGHSRGPSRGHGREIHRERGHDGYREQRGRDPTPRGLRTKGAAKGKGKGEEARQGERKGKGKGEEARKGEGKGAKVKSEGSGEGAQGRRLSWADAVDGDAEPPQRRHWLLLLIGGGQLEQGRGRGDA